DPLAVRVPGQPGRAGRGRVRDRRHARDRPRPGRAAGRDPADEPLRGSKRLVGGPSQPVRDAGRGRAAALAGLLDAAAARGAAADEPTTAPTAPSGVAGEPSAAAGGPILAVALIRATDREAWLAFQRALGPRGANGVEVDLRELAADEEPRIRALLRPEPPA